MRRTCMAMSALLLSGCADELAKQHRYIGQAPACAAGGGITATLVRNGRTFAFAPSDGSLVVNGTVAPNGTFSGTLALRSSQPAPETPTAQPSAPKTPQILSASGTLTDQNASVAYAAPGCQAKVMLYRVYPTVL